MCELVDLIKKHPCSIERENAINDLKRAGLVTAATIAGGIIYPLVYDALQLGNLKFMDQKVAGLPIAVWTTLMWFVVEIGGAGYAAIKGCQGAKHLLLPDHKLDGSNKEVTS